MEHAPAAPSAPVPPATVALIGLDAAASSLGTAMLRAGHDVRWWSPSSVLTLPQGAERASSAVDAVLGRDVVVVHLPDAATVRRVVLEGPDAVAGALGARAVLVDCSPVGPREARATARALEGRLLRVLEAALSGTERQAAEGMLSTHVGGDPETMEAVRPVLETWTAPGRLTWTGDAGSGAAARVVASVAGAVALHGVGELLRLGRDLGLARSVVLQVLMGGPLGSVVAARDRRLHGQDAGDGAAPVAERLADVLEELATALRHAGSALPTVEGAYLAARVAVQAGPGGDDVVALALAREGRAHLDDDDLLAGPTAPDPGGGA